LWVGGDEGWCHHTSSRHALCLAMLLTPISDPLLLLLLLLLFPPPSVLGVEPV
jgi:hypothetical protein